MMRHPNHEQSWGNRFMLSTPWISLSPNGLVWPQGSIAPGSTSSDAASSRLSMPT
jgi:hypothetical protein